MDLLLQPKPAVKLGPADKAIVSHRNFFVEKVQEDVKKYPNPCLLLRDWCPKARLLFPTPTGQSEDSLRFDAFVNRDVQSPFCDDDAEEVFLKNPPPSFVVLGQMDPTVTQLARDIAVYYGCVLIDTNRVVQDAVAQGGVIGVFLDKVLGTGVPLTLKVVLSLVSYEAHKPKARHSGYVLVGLPMLPQDGDMSAEVQINYLFLWDIKPGFFIHVAHDDTDLARIRSKVRREFVASEEDESYLVDDCTNINMRPSQRLVQLGPDEQGAVWANLLLYDRHVSDFVDLFCARMDPQRVIRVDARLQNMLQTVVAKLDLLSVLKAPKPMPFFPLHNESHETDVRGKEEEEETGEEADEEEGNEEEKEEEEMVEEEDDEDYSVKMKAAVDLHPKEAFPLLLNKNVIAPKSYWELSHYNYICPVALRNFRIVEGQSRFAVRFMRYIYFLSSEKAMLTFIENPRAFVLPVRPKPPSRFVVFGYPCSGKTSLAKELASEYQVPYIDIEAHLLKDRKLKRRAYREFCREMAEHMQMMKLNTAAWREWLAAEQERLDMIDDWISYIQCLLTQRIESFYSSSNSWEADGEWEDFTEERRLSGAESQSTTYTPDLNPYTSNMILQALGHQDRGFDEDRFIVEAEVLLSSLWNSFSAPAPLPGPHAVTFSEERPVSRTTSLSAETSDTSIVWANLLPSQSLSSLALQSKTLHVRRKRKSFGVMLQAAARYSFKPSALRSEFFRWKLQCWLDIPLCEKFHDNPWLLLRYLPECLKERPEVPTPVDKTDHSVLEAGNLAFKTAGLVQVRQKSQEIGEIMCRVIERAELEGEECVGDTSIRGGWVLDNMVFDKEVCNILKVENHFPNYIYILHEKDTDYQRIRHRWLTSDNVPSAYSNIHAGLASSTPIAQENAKDTTSKHDEDSVIRQRLKNKTEGIGERLQNCLREVMKGEKKLDEVYQLIKEGVDSRFYKQEEKIPSKVRETYSGLKNLSDLATGLDSNHCFIKLRSTVKDLAGAIGPSFHKYSKALLAVDSMEEPTETPLELTEEYEKLLEFYVCLLQQKTKLDSLKAWLKTTGNEKLLRDVDISGKQLPDVFKEIHADLMSPFIKKPRELLPFESREMKDDSGQDISRSEDEETLRSEFDGEHDSKDEEEGVDIYGESGSYCVSCLEQGVAVKGKAGWALRYCGKFYLFCTSKCKLEFISQPEKFAPFYSPLRCLPPPRIWVMGPRSGGKTTLAKCISQQLNLLSAEHLKNISATTVPHSPTRIYKSLNPTSLRSTIVSTSHNEVAQTYLSQFLKLPRSVRSDWLENPPYFSNDENEQKEVIKKFKMLEDFSRETTNIRQPSSDVLDSALPPDTLSLETTEAAVQDYVFKGTQLPQEVLDKSVGRLWKDEWAVVDGFVYDGYPYRSSDWMSALEKQWLPDLVIEIVMSEQEAVRRDVAKHLRLWKEKRAEEEEEDRRLGRLMSALHAAHVAKRRWYLISAKQEEFMGRGVVEPEDGIDKGSISLADEWPNSEMYMLTSTERHDFFEEVKAVISSEFPPLSWHTNWETESTARDRLKAESMATYQTDVAEIEQLKSKMKAFGLPWQEVSGREPLSRILPSCFQKLDVLKKRSGHYHPHCLVLDLEQAELLLNDGYYFPSKFGRWCPVQVFNEKNPMHMFSRLESHNITPVAFRRHIYFIRGNNEKAKFMEDPLKYVASKPHHTVLPLRMAVIGPPKCGKSRLAQRLASTFGLKCITVGSALRVVLEFMPGSYLRTKLEHYLRRGCFVPLALKVEAVTASMNDPLCVTQGFVLDGIPFDIASAQSLMERGCLPFIVLSLQTDVAVAKRNKGRVNIQSMSLKFSNREYLHRRYADWQRSYCYFAEWLRETYGNLYELDARTCGSVEIFYWACNIITSCMVSIRFYIENCFSDKVLPLEYLCVSLDEFNLRKSALENHCPVCWAAKKLRSSSDSMTFSDRGGLMQFREYFYWVCSPHRQQFQARPRQFFHPNAPDVPRVFPKILTSAERTELSGMIVHNQGRCVVTEKDFPRILNLDGSWDFAVKHGDEVYLMKTQEAQRRFLLRPWRYLDPGPPKPTLASDHDVNITTLPLAQLPILGYLEQTLAALIQRGLAYLGRIRPINSKVSPQSAAAAFFGLFLKVTNPHKRESHMEELLLYKIIVENQAHRYDKEKYTRKLRSEYGQGDDNDSSDSVAPSETDDSQSSTHSFTPKFNQSSQLIIGDNTSLDWSVMGIEQRQERMAWTAKYMDPTWTAMSMLEDGSLAEMPIVPKHKVQLSYQTYSLRCKPVPPVRPCLNFIYSTRDSLQLPNPFNYNKLFQNSPLFTSPFARNLMFNPSKNFTCTLYDKDTPADQSDLHKEEGTAIYTVTSTTVDEEELVDRIFTFMTDNYIPRFQIFDLMPSLEIPLLPVVMEDHRIFFNPHRAYTYLMLYSQLFAPRHYIRSFDWNGSSNILEYVNFLERNPSDIVLAPHVTESMRSLKSIASYQNVFDEACSFFVEEMYKEPTAKNVVLEVMEDILGAAVVRCSSTTALILLFDLMDRVMGTVRSASYDSFETLLCSDLSCCSVLSEPSVWFREILPFPPLPFTITAHPYYSLCAAPAIFSTPALDCLVHEQHLSLADGIFDEINGLRFQRYPTFVELQMDASTLAAGPANMSSEENRLDKMPSEFLPVFEFLHFPWTAFLAYPFEWASHMNLKDNWRYSNFHQDS